MKQHDLSEHGVAFGKPKIDIQKLVAWKNSIVSKLTGGLTMLAKQRKVTSCAMALANLFQLMQLK